MRKAGNASSQHGMGRDAEVAVDRARKQVADAIGAKSNEIYFTSGGSESDNWALKGIAHAYKSKGKHLITSEFEHPAVLNTMKQLEAEGFEVSYLHTNPQGYVSADELESIIRPDTILVSVMYANNEIGTIQPIEELAKVAHAHGAFSTRTRCRRSATFISTSKRRASTCFRCRRTSFTDRKVSVACISKAAFVPKD